VADSVALPTGFEPVY